MSGALALGPPLQIFTCPKQLLLEVNSLLHFEHENIFFLFVKLIWDIYFVSSPI